MSIFSLTKSKISYNQFLRVKKLKFYISIKLTQDLQFLENRRDDALNCEKLPIANKNHLFKGSYCKF